MHSCHFPIAQRATRFQNARVTFNRESQEEPSSMFSSLRSKICLDTEGEKSLASTQLVN